MKKMFWCLTLLTIVHLSIVRADCPKVIKLRSQNNTYITLNANIQEEVKYTDLSPSYLTYITKLDILIKGNNLKNDWPLEVEMENICYENYYERENYFSVTHFLTLQWDQNAQGFVGDLLHAKRWTNGGTTITTPLEKIPVYGNGHRKYRDCFQRLHIKEESRGIGEWSYPGEQLIDPVTNLAYFTMDI